MANLVNGYTFSNDKSFYNERHGELNTQVNIFILLIYDMNANALLIFFLVPFYDID